MFLFFILYLLITVGAMSDVYDAKFSLPCEKTYMDELAQQVGASFALRESNHINPVKLPPPNQTPISEVRSHGRIGSIPPPRIGFRSGSNVGRASVGTGFGAVGGGLSAGGGSHSFFSYDFVGARAAGVGLVNQVPPIKPVIVVSPVNQVPPIKLVGEISLVNQVLPIKSFDEIGPINQVSSVKSVIGVRPINQVTPVKPVKTQLESFVEPKAKVSLNQPNRGRTPYGIIPVDKPMWVKHVDIKESIGTGVFFPHARPSITDTNKKQQYVVKNGEKYVKYQRAKKTTDVVIKTTDVVAKASDLVVEKANVVVKKDSDLKLPPELGLPQEWAY